MAKLPGVNHKQAVNAFEKAGFWIARQGKHITMTMASVLLLFREQIRLIPIQWQEL